MTWNRKTTRKDRKRKTRVGRRFLAKVKRNQNEAFGFRRRHEWHIPFTDIRWAGWTTVYVADPLRDRIRRDIWSFQPTTNPVDTPPPAVP